MTPDSMRRAVLLDRDGVIIQPVLDRLSGTDESPYRPEDVRLVPGAAEALAELRARDLVLVVASNQPAAAKGTVTLAALHAVHERAAELLSRAGVVLDGWEYCFHHPDGGVPELAIDCDCRKPRPGMLFQAARRHRIELAGSWLVGDSDTDILAGQAAGTHTGLIEHPRTGHRRRGDAQADLIVPNLAEFASCLEAGALVG